jgi:hypothetical protein
MIVDGEMRAMLEAAEQLLEHGSAEDRFRVSSAFHAVLRPDATADTLEWATDYLRGRVQDAPLSSGEIERARQQESNAPPAQPGE